MKFTLGKKGLSRTWQKKFPEKTKCVHCKGEARIGFVAHEGLEEEILLKKCVCGIHKNSKGNLWPHDCITCAVYFCKKCLEPTALYNQG